MARSFRHPVAAAAHIVLGADFERTQNGSGQCLGGEGSSTLVCGDTAGRIAGWGDRRTCSRGITPICWIFRVIKYFLRLREKRFREVCETSRTISPATTCAAGRSMRSRRATPPSLPLAPTPAS